MSTSIIGTNSCIINSFKTSRICKTISWTPSIIDLNIHTGISFRKFFTICFRVCSNRWIIRPQNIIRLLYICNIKIIFIIEIQIQQMAGISNLCRLSTCGFIIDQFVKITVIFIIYRICTIRDRMLITCLYYKIVSCFDIIILPV